MNNLERPNSIFDDEGVKFAHFLENNGYTAEEMEEAYYEMLGVGQEDKFTDRIKELSTKMNEMTDAGFPLNQVASLIHLKEKWENMIPDFMSYVDSMKVSENEKRMLKSIIDENRTGEVSVYLEGEHLIDLQVPEVKSGEAKALQFRTFLENVIKTIPEGKKYEITFTEN